MFYAGSYVKMRLASSGALTINSSLAPEAAVDVKSTGTAANIYAQLWRNGSGIVVASMTSQGAFYAAVNNTVQAADAGITITAADFGKTITVNSGSAQTVTLPSVTAADIGATVTVVKLGAGKVTIYSGSGSLFIGDSNTPYIFNTATVPAFASVTIRLVTATLWILTGGNGAWITSISAP